jgi:hypothetical protein
VQHLLSNECVCRSVINAPEPRERGARATTVDDCAIKAMVDSSDNDDDAADADAVLQ